MIFVIVGGSSIDSGSSCLYFVGYTRLTQGSLTSCFSIDNSVWVIVSRITLSGSDYLVFAIEILLSVRRIRFSPILFAWSLCFLHCDVVPQKDIRLKKGFFLYEQVISPLASLISDCGVVVVVLVVSVLVALCGTLVL